MLCKNVFAIFAKEIFVDSVLEYTTISKCGRNLEDDKQVIYLHLYVKLY